MYEIKIVWQDGSFDVSIKHDTKMLIKVKGEIEPEIFENVSGLITFIKDKFSEN